MCLFPITKSQCTAAGGHATETDSLAQGRMFLAKQPEEFAHDADGNLLRDGRWTFGWDGENRLVSAETRAAAAAGVPWVRLEYAYDGRSRRIARTVRGGWNGTAYAQAETRGLLHDTGWNVLVETDGSLAPVRRCLWGLDLSGSIAGAGGVGGLLVEHFAESGGAEADCLPFYDGNGIENYHA